MQLHDFIHSSIILDRETRTLEQAVTTMLDRLAEQHLEPRLVPEILAAVLRREKVGSTAIGRGMAIPHAGRLPIDRVRSIVAVSPFGIEGNSIDGELVYVVFLLLLPPPVGDEHRLYRPETEALWRFLRNEDFFSQLRQARTEQEIDLVISTADQSYSFLGTV